MSKYKDLLNKIETLQQQAEEERRKEISEVVADIKKKMADYGITPKDLGLTGKSKGASASGQVPPKYRDPATGKTWTGRGRAPRWIADAEAKGKSREDFAI